jgi:hypothetical protein
MAWRERDIETGKEEVAGLDRTRELNKTREESLPAMLKEAEVGKKPFIPIHFQPVRSPGLYEAEFAKKGEDVIFHFWPYGYHEADRNNHAAPKFPAGFQMKLTECVGSVFGSHRVTVNHDIDMGAFFVCASGWASQQFWFDLAVKACQNLHTSLGGTDS